MSIPSGFYYLHTEGALIFKRFDDHREADLLESPFVRCYWPLNAGNFSDAWHIVIEAAVAGANPDRLRVLREIWGLDDKAAIHFANYTGVDFVENFVAPKFTACRYKAQADGETRIEALVALCKKLGWKASKDRVSFHDLLKQVSDD